MKILRKLNKRETLEKISIIILLVAFGLTYYKNNIETKAYQLKYEIINTKDMAMANVAEKKQTKTTENTNSVFQIYKQMKMELMNKKSLQ